MRATHAIADGYDLIIFDFDGTIARLSVDWIGMKRELSRTLDRPFDSLADGLAALRSSGDAEAINTYWDIVRRFEWDDPVGLAGNDDVIQFLRTVRPGRSVAVCSSNAHSTVERALALLDIADCIDFLVAGDDVAHAKPHPEGVETIVAHFGSDKQRTLFIGDTEIDLDAGKAAGVRTLLVRNGALPDHV